MLPAKARLMLAIIAAPTTFGAISNAATETAAPAAIASKTYLNKHFGFAFEHPESWTLVEKQDAQGEALLSLKFLSRDENVAVLRDYSPGSVGIEVYANPTRKTAREWLNTHGWPFGAEGRSATPTSVGGLPALDVATGKMFAPNRFIYVANKEWILRLSVLAPDSDKVLQSFHFDP